MSETCSPRKILALRAEGVPIVDVRSPGEFSRAHLLGAYSLPLFSNEERAAVGTLYAQEGRDAAVELGLEYVGGKMRSLVQEAKKLAGESGRIGVVSNAPDKVCGARRLHGSFLLPGYRCIVWREATAPITRR